MRARRRTFNRRRVREMVMLAALAVILLVVHHFLPEPPTVSPKGTARVIDGDSLRIGRQEIRLRGIDAPELAQTCERKGQSWRCGEAAARRLRRHIGSQPVACSGNRFDSYHRLLAVCTVDGVELNRWLVEQGWAVSYDDYPKAERMARKAGRGLWSSTFERPRDWRDRHPRSP